MKKTFAYIRNCLISHYSQNEIESFISIIFKNIYNYSKHDIIINDNRIISESDFNRIEAIVKRLKTFEPIQYILGETEFFGLYFGVNSSVLIPRSETEELVDLILKKHKHDKIRILDVGTGSGCIPISIKYFNPFSTVFSCDISEKAIETAQNNARLNQVDISFLKYDILSSHSFEEKDFDLIVSNPPYVTEKEKLLMEENVLNFEPHLALFVPDDDPLKFYKAIVAKSSKWLKSKGEIYLEINEAYGQEIIDLLKNNNFESQLVKDINGKDRIAFGQKKQDET